MNTRIRLKIIEKKNLDRRRIGMVLDINNHLTNGKHERRNVHVLEVVPDS